MYEKSLIPGGARALALALTGLASTAAAQQQVFMDSVPLTTTNWTDSVTIPRFDPDLGTLLSMEIELEAFTQGTARYESQDAQATTVTLNFAVGITLRRPDNSALVAATPTLTQVEGAAPFDGVLDFDGPSGSSFLNLSQSQTETATAPPPLSDLTLFTGPAGNPGTITLPVQAVGMSQGSGAGNLVLQFTAMAGANVTVRYNFIPDCNMNGIPDPDDISSGLSQDCNGNGIPDECDVPPDCNLNGVPDECEPDCNNNGQPDDCDIAGGASQDADGNGVPDECDEPECKRIHRRTPGSLLLYPKFDNNPGTISVITVTNTNCESTGNPFTDNIDVEFVYIDREGCDEFNRVETLTPCDTITVLTRAHNPNQEMGFLYVFARRYPQGPAVSYNHLIGQGMVLDGTLAQEYATNAVAFRSPKAQGELTDVNGNGLRDMDGVEYDEAPDEILVPRFLGQCEPKKPDLAGGRVAGGPRNICVESELVLVGLTGGAAFLTTVDFLIYNDNEEVFSAEYSFNCWDNPRLLDISFAFGQDWLENTNHDLAEILGAPYLESGWFRLNGALADSLATSIPEPAVYAMLIERVGGFAVADLPFEYCTQTNGALLARNLFGTH